jgi:hypothetical protein
MKTKIILSILILNVLCIFAQEKPMELFEKDNYSIEYPKKWKMESPGPLYEPFCLTGPKEEEYVYINLIQEEDKEEWPAKKFNEYIDYQAKELRNGSNKPKKEKISDYNYKIEFQTTVGNEIFKSVRYFYLVNEDIFLLTFCADDKFFNSYFKQGEEIIKTFKINGQLKN